MEREERVFPSSSGMCNIHTVIWYPDNSIYSYPVGVIQIADLRKWQNSLLAKAL